MKSQFVCLKIRNKDLSMTILRKKRYLRTEFYSPKATQIFFKIILRDWTAPEILQKMPKNLTQRETRITSFKGYAWQRSPRNWYWVAGVQDIVWKSVHLYIPGGCGEVFQRETLYRIIPRFSLASLWHGFSYETPQQSAKSIKLFTTILDIFFQKNCDCWIHLEENLI